MKVYEILALSRSGHHSVVNWIIKNTVGFQCDWTYKMTELGPNGLFYLNETNHDIPLSFEYITEKKEKIKKLYLNYEDTPGGYTVFNDDNTFRGPMSVSIEGIPNVEFVSRVIIIRDFYNLLSSRLKLNENKKNKEWVGDNHFMLEVGQKFIYRWKSQAKSCIESNTPYLRFEDWLNNKEIRDKFLFDNFGLVDNFGIKSIFGTRSSFGSHEGVSNRSQELVVPEEIKELINQDNELHYLIGRLGYEFKKV